jgi:hypothetical protein
MNFLLKKESCMIQAKSSITSRFFFFATLIFAVLALSLFTNPGLAKTPTTKPQHAHKIQTLKNNKNVQAAKNAAQKKINDKIKNNLLTKDHANNKDNKDSNNRDNQDNNKGAKNSSVKLSPSAQLKGSFERQEVNKFVKQFNGSKEFIIKTSQENPDFSYIKQELAKRNLPHELAMLPMIESQFKADAVSHKGAKGIWQIMPATGKQLGLEKEEDIKDVKSSTGAALDYLEYLHKKFNRDWMLTLAAYNAGEGNVAKAIQRNKKTGKPTNFWSLKLPKETKNYVPKFLAVSRILNQNQAKQPVVK